MRFHVYINTSHWQPFIIYWNINAEEGNKEMLSTRKKKKTKLSGLSGLLVKLK